MKQTKTYLAACLVSVFFVHSAPTQAETAGEQLARQGNGKGAPACNSCHGDQGQGNPAAGYPYLAGQSQAYLSKQLHDFASGKRANPIMAPFAKALSETEINALAGYFSGLPLPATQPVKADKKYSGLGQRIAANGKWSQGVPACVQCHGDVGQGVPPNFPAISGQAESYLKTQLTDWKNGRRSNDPIGLMTAVVKQLTTDEINAVAAYFASRSPSSNH